MSVIEIIGGVCTLLASVLIIILCIAQSQKQQDMSSALSGQSDNFYGKNGRGSSREEALASLTRIMAIIFFVVTLAVYIIGAVTNTAA